MDGGRQGQREPGSSYTALPELTDITYTFLGGQFTLEAKELVKVRLGQSPDLADALSETFDMEELPSGIIAKLQGRHKVRHDGDPYTLPRHDESGVGSVEHDSNPID